MTRHAAPGSRAVHVFILLLLLTSLVFARICVFRPANNLPGWHYNRGSNAAWLDITWAKDPHDQADVEALVQHLTRRQITYAFIYVSYLRSDGQFNPTYSHAANFIRAAKSTRPELNIQAWIGLPLDNSGFLAQRGHVDLSDDATRSEIAEFSSMLVHEIGFDGIHLDPEPIESGDPGVPALLQEVRRAIGPKPILSIATRRIWPFFPSISLPINEGQLLPVRQFAYDGNGALKPFGVSGTS